MSARSRIAAVATGLCLAVAATPAIAASATGRGGSNRYLVSVSVRAGTGAGHSGELAPASARVSVSVVNTTASDVPAPVTYIRSRILALRIAYARRFPVCTPRRILADHGNHGRFNGVCPARSLVATGSVYAVLTSPATHLAGPGTPCHARLWVYNDGPGRLTMFLTAPPLLCRGLTTGDAAPWVADYRQVGAYLQIDAREPADVSYDAAHVKLFGSLEHETLVFRALSVSSHGRTYPFLATSGCRRGGLSYSVAVSATRSPSGAPAGPAATLRSQAACTRLGQ